MAPLSRQEKRKTKVRSISQFYTAVCVDGFVWVHKYTPGKRVLCFGGFQNRATTLSILSRRPHPPITFAGFPPAFHLKTVFQFQSLQREPPYLLCFYQTKSPFPNSESQALNPFSVTVLLLQIKDRKFSCLQICKEAPTFKHCKCFCLKYLFNLVRLLGVD